MPLPITSHESPITNQESGVNHGTHGTHGKVKKTVVTPSGRDNAFTNHESRITNHES